MNFIGVTFAFTIIHIFVVHIITFISLHNTAAFIILSFRKVVFMLDHQLQSIIHAIMMDIFII